MSSSDQRWSQAYQALGGVSKLVTNGEVDSDGRLPHRLARHRHQG